MKKDKSLIHVGFQYEEAIDSKKDLLFLEMNLLELAKDFTNYHSLRSEELKLKLKLYIRIKELMNNLKKLKRVLPKLKIPKILKEAIEEKEVDVEKIKEESEPKYGSDLESQLQKIKDKLKTLQ